MKTVILLALLVFSVIIYHGEGQLMSDGVHVIHKRSPEEHSSTVANVTDSTALTNDTMKASTEIGPPFNSPPLGDSATNSSFRRALNDSLRIELASGTPNYREHSSVAVLFMCLLACLPKDM